MIKCLLKPILREQGVIVFSNPLLSLKKNQTYIAISDQKIKKYSFFVKILDFIQKEDENRIPILEIDSRRLGILGDNDSIELHPYNTPVADRIEIGISEEDYRGIPAGNWTSTILTSLMGKSYDWGDQINFSLEYGDKSENKITVVRGFLINSHATPPVTVGQNSRCEIIKLDNKQLRAKIEELEQKKIKRVDKFLSQEEYVKFPDGKQKSSLIRKKCPECNSVISLDQLDSNVPIICENCGYEINSSC